MIAEVKKKFSDISKRQPDYLGDYEYNLIKTYYHSMYDAILKSITNINLDDIHIEMIIDKCDNSFLHIRRLCDDRIAILILNDLTDFLQEIMEDCAELELYESAHNLKRILNYINEGDV